MSSFPLAADAALAAAEATAAPRAATVFVLSAPFPTIAVLTLFLFPTVSAAAFAPTVTALPKLSTATAGSTAAVIFASAANGSAGVVFEAAAAANGSVAAGLATLAASAPVICCELAANESFVTPVTPWEVNPEAAAANAGLVLA